MQSVRHSAAGQNRLFPIFLKMESLHTLIVGGGNVGLEKLNAILQNDPAANVTLVGSTVQPAIRQLAAGHGNVEVIEKSFSQCDLYGKDLVIVATDDPALNEQIRDMAKARKILVNVADTPLLCDFYLSSIVQKGNIKIAISTNGQSPTIAKRLKEVLYEAIPDEMEKVLANLTRIRQRLKGDFAEKVKQLNQITAVLVKKGEAGVEEDEGVK